MTNPPATAEDSVFLRFENTTRLLPWKEISHIIAEGNYTQAYTSQGPAVLVFCLMPPRVNSGAFGAGMNRSRASRLSMINHGKTHGFGCGDEETEIAKYGA